MGIIPDNVGENLGLGGTLKGAFQLGFIGKLFLGLLIAIAIVGILVMIYLWYRKKKQYTETIEVWGNVNNSPQLLAKDTARFIRVSLAGDYILYVKRHKKWLPPPTLQAGKHRWFFWKRSDGEWINFTLADLDEQQRKMKAEMVEFDMRAHRIGIEKILKFRLQKEKWWQKHFDKIIMIIFVVVITVCLIVLFTRLEGAWTASTQMSSAVKEMAEAVYTLSTKVGSGLVPVT